MNPISSPSFFHMSNSSGVTHCSTFKCRFVGRRYCPNVTTCTPAPSKSRIVCRTSACDSPSPSITLVFVTSPGTTSFARASTARLCAYPARRSRTAGCRRSTVSTLCAKTSRPDDATRSTPARSPVKSGVSASTMSSGCARLISRTVSEKCFAPPSGTSSRSTEVRTTYLSPHFAMASATLRGSLGSSGGGALEVLMLQKRQPRVQVSPMSMRVAVPPPQHSPMLGHRASSQTVERPRRRASARSREYSGESSWSPAGRTLSHLGFFGFS
mmetsp:Transcript_20009/g.53282  ORF Transcript_20009/g.53282 Transcript_20009/m.53282 type:complete len:270 (+) Transcript_20009:2297-3106(+)